MSMPGGTGVLYSVRESGAHGVARPTITGEAARTFCKPV